MSHTGFMGRRVRASMSIRRPTCVKVEDAIAIADRKEILVYKGTYR